MIIRLIAVDPSPRLGKSDVLVYQVPENSREYEFLIKLLDGARIEWTTLTVPYKPRRKRK
jgi:hypothetical protein